MMTSCLESKGIKQWVLPLLCCCWCMLLLYHYVAEKSFGEQWLPQQHRKGLRLTPAMGVNYPLTGSDALAVLCSGGMEGDNRDSVQEITS